MVPSPTDGEEIFLVHRPFSQLHAFPQPLPGVDPWPGRSPGLSVSPSFRLQGGTGLAESWGSSIRPRCRYPGFLLPDSSRIWPWDKLPHLH